MEAFVTLTGDVHIASKVQSVKNLFDNANGHCYQLLKH